MRRALDGVVATLVLVNTVGAGFNLHSSDTAAQPLNSWTIMIYMAADNAVPLPWEADINEMEAAQQDENTNIIALLDTYDLPNSRLLRIGHDPNGLDSTIVSEDLDDNGAVVTGGEVNTGSPDTLRDFVQYCVSEFPAHSYALILWGHGAGWHGLCPDGFDFLTLVELRQALTEAEISIGRVLDLVEVDACAQGSMEMISQLGGLTNVFVASEKNVPYEGLPYVQVLNSLAANPGMTPIEFGRSIADQYYLWSTINSLYSTTIAVYDMEYLSSATQSLSVLSSVGMNFNELFHATMKAAAEDAEHYENEWHVDMGNLLYGLSSSDLPLELKEAALGALLAYSQLVSYSKLYSKPDPIDDIWANRSTGAVIYLQGNSLPDSEYLGLEISTTNWDEFGSAVREDSITMKSEPGPIVDYLDTDSDFTANALVLTWYGSYDECTVRIYRRINDGVQFVRTETSVNQTIFIAEVPGYLELSASASTDGSAKSYRIINASIEGQSYLEVVVWDDGERIVDGIELRLESDIDSQEFPEMPSPYVVPIEIPYFAEVGDIVAVQIIDTDSGDVVGQSRTVVQEGNWSVQVEVHETKEKASGLGFLLLVLMPGILVLAYAYVLSRDVGRRNR